jgi:hypothetical protein
LRNMSGTYFSTDCYETPPCYAEANSENRDQAAKFVYGFRRNPVPARPMPLDTFSGPTLPTYRPPLWRRFRRFLSAAAERPDIFDYELLRIAAMVYVAPFRSTVRGIRRRRNAMQFDIAGLDALPKRFIFYPLQYTPEASINTPAPYFVDQMRTIDALRFAMPSDYTLVVKEHPACIEMRPAGFMRRLRKLPGVTVIKFAVPSLELIRRAALTVTVTGTAGFEAFLLGRPALALGPGLSAWALGSVSNLADLRTQILRAIDEPLSDNFVIDQVARLVSTRYPFFFDTPHLPGEPVLRESNMKGFLNALFDHLERERSFQAQGNASVA